MQTIGTRAGKAHTGDFVATCAYCGAAWYRSKLRRNPTGQLICPDDRHIRDPVTLSRLNAQRASKPSRNRVDGGVADTVTPTTSGPLVVCPELVVTGWEASSGVTLDSVGRASVWAAQHGGFTLEQPNPNALKPLVKTNGPNGRTYVAFEGAHALVETSGLLTRPAPSVEPTFYWAVVNRPRWRANNAWWNFGSGTLTGAIDSSSAGVPNERQFHTTGVNTVSFPMGPFRRVESLFSASTSDYLKIGNVETGGTSAGDGAGIVNFTLGASSLSSNFAWLGVLELWILNAKPSDAQRVRLDNYARAKYGGEVLL